MPEPVVKYPTATIATPTTAMLLAQLTLLAPRIPHLTPSGKTLVALAVLMLLVSGTAGVTAACDYPCHNPPCNPSTTRPQRWLAAYQQHTKYMLGSSTSR